MARTWAKVAILVAILVVAVAGTASALQRTGSHVAARPLQPACAGSPETFGNMTLEPSPCSSYGFYGPVVENATLSSKKVLPLIETAYDYHVVYFANSTTDSGVYYAVLNVTEAQHVRGNWTIGYSISYVGNELLNVTVLHVVGAVYEVAHVSAYPLPSRNSTLAYTPQEGQAIQTALANSTVTSLMGGKPYYVELVAPTPGASGQTFIVQLYQVDGTGVVGAFVNTGLGQVTGSFTEHRISGSCWPDGIVITDPWDATGYSGCKA